jgi:FtsP/CotA-like multicopper oxidase with cupredoxin domain
LKIDRRSFIALGGTAAVAPLLPAVTSRQVYPRSIAKRTVDVDVGTNGRRHAADHILRIEPCALEIRPGLMIKTVAYNGQIPGPLLRLREGVPVTIEVINGTQHDEIVHWHGLIIDSLNDGAMEEGSPMIPAGGRLRYSITPQPAGTRWYHTHTRAGSDLSLGAYTGQFGFLLVEAGQPIEYDHEVFLAIHHWEPFFAPMPDMMRDQSANRPATSGSDVAYRYATINQHMLGAGEPIRVKQGQRVLFRLLNASATENVLLALPGHTFKIVALDGNPVPAPKSVEVISLAVAERVDAIVEMTSPGVWILGSTLERSRASGLGVVVEYAGSSGPPVWRDPVHTPWDYSLFAATAPAADIVETFQLTFMDNGPQKGAQFDTWVINGKSWPDVEPIIVERGKRYRLMFRNASADQHPMHLHRHSFEVVKIGNTSMSGLIKDTINVMPLQTVVVDFVAANPGDSLLHCHMQLHMDFGFMQMIRYRN